tara:strand:- start:13265 stop:13573 length:309 start_codon:yes stop_codon:yes gene_type:complete
MTTVTIFRATTAEDEYGDPKPATWSQLLEFDAKVGWEKPDEASEPTRRTEVTRRAVFARGVRDTGIRATDEAEIAGVRYSIEGTIAQWPSGTHFTVRAVGSS